MHGTKRRLAGVVALSAMLGLGMAPGATAAAKKTKGGANHHPKSGGGFVGVSSQASGKLALPVDLRVSPDGGTMTRFDIQWSATCQSQAGRGSYGGLSITLNKKIVPATGVFGDTGSFTRAFSNGDKGLFAIKLFGQFSSPLRAAGTFQVTVDISDGTGAKTDHCDSGVVNWTALD